MSGPTRQAGPVSVADQPRVFVFKHVRERTLVNFRDWPSARDTIFSDGRPAFLACVHAELGTIVAHNHTKVLAIDMSPVDYVPSSFIGELLMLHKRGVMIELLRPSPTIRQILETTRLNSLFVVRE
jgi:hypothetical protein